MQILTVLVLLFVLPFQPRLDAEGEPLLLVADFELEGISEREMKLLVDLFSYTLFETGDYIVINRYERNKLIRGFGYDEKKLGEIETYIEAGELLRASYVVTGSCVLNDGLASLSLVLWEVRSGAEIASVKREAPGFEGLVEECREITFELTGKRPNPKSAPSTGLSQSLYVSRFRERILLVLPAPPLDDATASARFLASEAARLLSASEKVSLAFSSLGYDPAEPDLAAVFSAAKKRDCHSAAFIRKKDDSFSLAIIDERAAVKLALPLDIVPERSIAAARLAEKLESDYPLIEPAILVRELEREITIKEKLDLLLANEKFLGQRLFICLRQNLFTPSIAGKYHPLLNLVSAEADCILYYSGLIGVGAGYGFSISYPGTIDSALAGHPLVTRHELRVIPLSFRTPGKVGVLANAYAALLCQNAYKISYYQFEDRYEYTDETLLIGLKAGFDLGVIFNINDDVSLFLDLVNPSAVFPANASGVTYDGSNLSGGAGGIGVIFRF